MRRQADPLRTHGRLTESACLMGRRFVHADADHMGNAIRRSDRDREFLATLATCEKIGARAQVESILLELEMLDGPEWRRVACRRTLEKMV